LSTEVSRLYASKRQGIVTAMAEQLKVIDGNGAYLTDLDYRAEPTLKYWDEIEQFPAVHINAGSESREYIGAGHKNRFLSVTLRLYVNEEESVNALDSLIEDVETVLEDNSRLAYKDKLGVQQYTHQITIISIDTDEGVLDPIGVAEMLVEVRY